MSDVVPPEVMSHIFTRLPVKSLLRFRCVSKPVKAFIDSQSFIKAHLKGQLLKPNSDLKLFIRHSKTVSIDHDFTDTLFSLDFTCIGTTQPQRVDQPFPLTHPIQVLSCLHGLVFISSNLCINDNALWNPSTNQFRQLPFFDYQPGKPLGNAGGMNEFCGGFGYDSSTDDYKVVKIAQSIDFDDNSLACQTMIFSLKLGLWKKCDSCCPYYLLTEDTGTFAGGALNWLAAKDPFGYCQNLVAFNLATETFQELPFPDNFGIPLHLSVLEECLSLVSTRTKPGNPVLDHADVWVMREYGLKQSWVKLFSVEQLAGRQHFNHLRPLAFSVTGKDVLLEMNHKKFLWYNLEQKSVRFAKISIGLEPFKPFICLGTLVPVYGGGHGNETI